MGTAKTVKGHGVSLERAWKILFRWPQGCYGKQVDVRLKGLLGLRVQ